MFAFALLNPESKSHWYEQERYGFIAVQGQGVIRYQPAPILKHQSECK